MSRDGLLDLARPGVLLLQSLRFRLVKGLTLGVRGLVTDAQEGVLLVRHSYVSGWHLPGGAVEPGETAVQSLARELVEEASIGIVGEARLMGLYFNARMRGRDHVAVFHVADYERLAPFKPNGEILEARFFSPTDLPPTATAATRRRMAEHFDGAAVSPEW
jgi:ADP-ribose pyrophosphatase YjhB (NUDIX family)